MNGYRNTMGTLSFDYRFEGMRKSQDFIVYPMESGSKEVYVQSSTRFGRVDLVTGDYEMSGSHSNGAGSAALCIDRMKGKTRFGRLPMVDLEDLVGGIRGTGGVLVGDSFVKVDNSGALEV